MIHLLYGNFFLHFFEILDFTKIWKTLCTDFVNYFVEILRIKLFQDDFGKTVVIKETATVDHSVATAKKNIVEKCLECKTFFKNFLAHFLNFFISNISIFEASQFHSWRR